MRNRNVKELKKLMEERIHLQKHRSTMRRFLISKGLSSFLVEEMLESQSDPSNIDNELLQLKEKLSSKIQTFSGFNFLPSEQLVVALVGGNGIGKTTTLLKILNHYRKEKKIGVLGLDFEEEVIERYSRLWNFPYAKGQERFSSLKDLDLILIDTPGCSFYDTKNVSELEKTFTSLGKVEVHLVLSAASKEVDLYGALHQFSTLDIKSLIFTKLDETLTPGVLVNVSSKVDFPISFIAFDFPLPGKIEIATPELITHKILTDFNGEMFHFLRQMAQTT